MKRHFIKVEDKDMLEDVDCICINGERNKVLVIVNTINKAIELYQEIKSRTKCNVRLLHSRFTVNDRNELENEIKEFSKNRDEKGIWITTQIVEASLDIDFDYLYTEMSTLDSLFQRLGRCYRSREYDKTEPNVYIYTKNLSGVGSVYNKYINEKSIEFLNQYNNDILEEKIKIELVDKLYSKEVLEGTEFLHEFESGMKVLNNIMDYETDKTKAQKLLRNIETIKVIPKVIYDANLDLFSRYENEIQKSERRTLKRQIDRLTTTITGKSFYIFKEKVSAINCVEGIYCIDLKYDKNIGLILKEDEEYSLNSRFL